MEFLKQKTVAKLQFLCCKSVNIYHKIRYLLIAATVKPIFFIIPNYTTIVQLTGKAKMLYTF